MYGSSYKISVRDISYIITLAEGPLKSYICIILLKNIIGKGLLIYIMSNAIMYLTCMGKYKAWAHNYVQSFNQ